MTHFDDLSVDPISDALAGFDLDLVISGSIGAVESPRLIRSLRRLGAKVRPWLTAGGAQFTTTTSLAWAANHPVRTDFLGNHSHLAGGDACIVAPASASMLAKIARGQTDCPATALIQSYLGSGRPVLILANMHDSLAQAPAVSQNLATISQWATILGARQEEGKQKFPEPSILADRIAHHLHYQRHKSSQAPLPRPILILMGTTRAYFDDVRYISNVSSGAMGTAIAECFFRQGFPVHVVAGPCQIIPACLNDNELSKVETNEEMAIVARQRFDQGIGAAIFAAAVLDYAPEARTQGKLRSGQGNHALQLVPQRKIIGELRLPEGMPKIGFKLEPTVDAARAEAIAADYFKRYQLSMLIANSTETMGGQRHFGFAVEQEFQGSALQPAQRLDSRAQIAKAILAHVAKRLV